MGRFLTLWHDLFQSHPVGSTLAVAIGILFLVAGLAFISVFNSRYRIPATLEPELTISRLVPNLRDEANKLARKLQNRVTGYTVLNFVLVMIEILGSLFFAVTGLHGQFSAGGQDLQRISAPAELTTAMGIAILLAGALKAGFQPNTRKVEYARREWLLSNTINDAEISIAEYNSQNPPNSALLSPVPRTLSEAIKKATEPLK